jgi:hypothetical protein
MFCLLVFQIRLQFRVAVFQICDLHLKVFYLTNKILVFHIALVNVGKRFSGDAEIRLAPDEAANGQSDLPCYLLFRLSHRRDANTQDANAHQLASELPRIIGMQHPNVCVVIGYLAPSVEADVPLPANEQDGSDRNIGAAGHDTIARPCPAECDAPTITIGVRVR